MFAHGLRASGRRPIEQIVEASSVSQPSPSPLDSVSIDQPSASTSSSTLHDTTLPMIGELVQEGHSIQAH
ncbi:hypothetical protein EVAR_5345_1 [Eumeta japonica]|uniref:Uncharacterized protein n=1 Tax=Eumeta variegata TaxID=151549 RepID=A0A4C1TNQ6_EUMVA|nr:hypothetical protein EVAR_5345_1 [Eumeta japonica]